MKQKTYNLLAGKRGLIFGAFNSKSIAWHAALKAQKEGAIFVLSNTEIAARVGKINELGKLCNCPVILADITDVNQLENLFYNTLEELGGKLDFILHSVAMSPNVRKGKDYGDLDYEAFMRTLDISAVSFHKVMQVAEKTDAMKEWGSILAVSYIAAQRTFPGYSDMAEAKAALESIARSYGYRWAKLKKVRVNTISQSPTVTTAGSGIKGFDIFYDYANKMSPLGNADAEHCANYITFMFSDLSRMITMQNLMHDGGFSSSGITEDLIDKLYPQDLCKTIE
jgi:enoyl-[acyl-carrier protein] reductase I